MIKETTSAYAYYKYKKFLDVSNRMFTYYDPGTIGHAQGRFYLALANVWLEIYKEIKNDED